MLHVSEAVIVGGLVASAGATVLASTHEPRFFTLHPLLAQVWFLASTLAIVYAQRARTGIVSTGSSGGTVTVNNGKQRGDALQKHWVLNVPAIGGLVFAFLVAYINKDLLAKTHFKSNHSWVGLATVALCLVQLALGLAIYTFPATFFHRAPGRLAKANRWHRLLGVVLFAVSLATVALGFYTHWFQKAPWTQELFVLGETGTLAVLVGVLVNSDVVALTSSLVLPALKTSASASSALSNGDK